MLAISVKQPYAEMIASGSKKAEYRSWPTNQRGDLLIVASKKAATADGAHMPAGVSICVVKLVGCRQTKDGWAWILENPRRVEAMPINGSAAFYHVPDDLIRYVDTVDAIVAERAAKSPAFPAHVERAKAARVARVKARRVGPYSLHLGRATIAKGITTPAEARQLARAYATKVGAYVRIHRDGLEISGERPR